MELNRPADATFTLLARLLVTDVEMVRASHDVLSDGGYNSWEVPKGNGRTRRIDAPVDELKETQSLLLSRLFCHAPISPFAHGFVPGRSIATNATVHQQTGRSLVSLDLEDAYPSVMRQRVVKTLEWGVGYFLKHVVPCSSRGSRDALYELIADLCCFRQCLPQGAPTSGMLLNMACCSLDRRCARLLRRCRDQFSGLRYTRYADDLSFTSSEELSHEFLEQAIGCVVQAGFRVNRRKVKRYSIRNADLVICGIRLHEGQLTLPRKVLRRYRAMLFQSLAYEPDEISEENRQFLLGHIGFLTMASSVCPPQLERLLEEVLQQHGSWLRSGVASHILPSYDKLGRS